MGADKSRPTPGRSPERAALGAAIEKRDAAAATLAAAVKQRSEVEGRLAKERRELSDARAADDDAEVGRDLGDLDLLVRRSQARRQKADAATEAIGVLERAGKARAREVNEKEDALSRAGREVEKAARIVLSAAMTPLFAGLAAMQAEVARRRLSLAFLLRNETVINGPGRLSDQAQTVRAFLRLNQLPSDEFTPPELFADPTQAAWAAALEKLAVDPDAEVPFDGRGGA
jgi:hypothetical protein